MKPEPPIRPAWLRGLALVVVGTVLGAYAWWPMIANYPHTPEEDGRYVYHQFEIAKAALRYYHEIPLWNPFDCHGIAMWDYPEAMTASPLLYLTAPFDTVVTLIVWNLAHVVAGFVGMWLLVRDELKLSRAAGFVAACMFSLAVCHTSQYAGEHETMVTFLLAPLLLLLWRRAENSANAAVGLGIVLALMLYNGATYPLPFSGVMLGLETLTRIRSRARFVKILKAGALVGASALLLAAARLIPLQAELSSHQRALASENDVLKPNSIWMMFTLRTPQWRAHFNGQTYVFGEYIAYIGPIGVALSILGMVLCAVEEAWLAFLAAALFAIMVGHFAKWSPWSLMHSYVPPFKNMRVPARFRHLLMVCLSAFVAYAIDKLPARMRSFGISPNIARATRVVLLGAALIAVGDAVGLGLDIETYRWNGPVPAHPTRSYRFYYGGPGLAGDFADQPRQNRAWLGCRAYEWMWRADAPLWQGDVIQARAADDGATVTGEHRTHNTFTVDVDAKRPTRILLNSAYAPGWRSDVGKVVENPDKLLAVDVPEGTHHIKLHYWPPYMTLGLSLTAAGWLLVLGVFFRKRLRALLARARGGE
jgi:hypothetical protein